MATEAVPSRSQVAAKWQESFNRLNESVPGISGFLSFSEVCCILLERKKNISLTGTIIGVTVEYRDTVSVSSGYQDRGYKGCSTFKVSFFWI